MRLKVGCAQVSPAKAEVARNLDMIAEVAIQASQEGVDLLLFPETSTSGYFLEGGVLEAARSLPQLQQELGQRLQGKLQRPLDVALGFYELGNGHVYNAAAYFELGADSIECRGSYRKFFLPTYGVFDEERFVARGRDLAVFNTRFGSVAFLICEDVWHSILPTLCAVRGAQILLVPSASPARGFTGSDIENHSRYRRLMTAISEEHGIVCVNAQLCGFEGGKGFVGGSMVSDPFGKVVAEAPIAEPHLLVAEVDLDLVAIARAQSPLLSDLQGAWQDLRRLVEESA